MKVEYKGERATRYANFADNSFRLRVMMNKFFGWLEEGGHLLLVVVHPLRFTEHHTQYFEDNLKLKGLHGAQA